MRFTFYELQNLLLLTSGDFEGLTAVKGNDTWLSLATSEAKILNAKKVRKLYTFLFEHSLTYFNSLYHCTSNTRSECCYKIIKNGNTPKCCEIIFVLKKRKFLPVNAIGDIAGCTEKEIV
jgi:hypothetical protein